MKPEPPVTNTVATGRIVGHGSRRRRGRRRARGKNWPARIVYRSERGKDPSMRRLLVALALTSILAGIGAAYAFASTKSVRVGDNFFSRSSITIKRGTALNWHW